MQPTPLRGTKIGGILETDFVPTPVPIYRAARLMCTVGPLENAVQYKCSS
jgi:hypothetical protein